ncbi:MAG: cysteine hydrolase [Bacteroidales bacterium]|nr:cysteine hydrolase [Candidatus Latescibacterota bacterium]
MAILKEKIFVTESGDPAERIMTGLGPYLKTEPLLFSPERSALLVLDMQGYFVDPGSRALIPSAPDIVQAVSSLADAFESAGAPTIFTRHLDVKGEAGMMERWWGGLICREDPLSKIWHELELEGREVLDKSKYDAFWGTGLDERLRDVGVERLVIAGVMTHLCVETTVRSAFMRDYEVFVPVDATATYNRELFDGSLRAIAHGFAVPVSTGSILETFDVE